MVSKPQYLHHPFRINIVLKISQIETQHHPKVLVSARRSEVTAEAAERLREGGLGKAKVNRSNVARDAYRMIRRTGVSWKIPIESFDYKKIDGTFFTTHYVLPQKIVQHFIEHKPAILCGEHDAAGLSRLCSAFWEAYEGYHSNHPVFEAHAGVLDHVIPLAIWGGEGKGKRRSTTTLVTLEACIGIKGSSCGCKECTPSNLDVSQWGPTGDDEHLLAKQIRTNMKTHSYIQHWPLFIVPSTLDKNYKPLVYQLMDLVSENMEQLFRDGVQVGTQRWFGALIGAKGDLRWFQKIGRLVRSFEHQGRTNDIPMCHHCQAGGPGIPAEDVASHHPCWERTLFSQRPWLANDPPPMSCISYDMTTPERLYQHDTFHTLRVGLFRDFVGSVIFLCVYWGFFGNGALPVKLNAAWGSFALWQYSEGKPASLRSFSKALFNYKARSSFPWINAKGSDVTLCMKWLRTAVTGFIQCCNDGEQTRVLNTIVSTCKMGILFFDVMNSHRMWLSVGCGAHLYEVGHAFLVGYTYLAGYAYQNQLCLFSVKPKAHFFRHILLTLLQQLEANTRVILNPLTWDCEQNEDQIGKITSLVLKLDSRYCTKRVLEFWMVKSFILVKRHLPKPMR